MSHSSPNDSRGLTLVEVLIATALSAILAAGVVILYVFAWRTWSITAARQMALQRADGALRAVLADARDGLAYDVQPRSPGAALVVTLPADADGDGLYYPVAASEGVAYRPGPVYAYYLSDQTGRYDRQGDALWRGRATPGAGLSRSTVSPDKAWSVYYDTGRPKHDGLVALEFDAGPGGSEAYFTCSVTAASDAGDEDSPRVTVDSGAFLRHAQFVSSDDEEAHGSHGTR